MDHSPPSLTKVYQLHSKTAVLLLHHLSLSHQFLHWPQSSDLLLYQELSILQTPVTAGLRTGGWRESFHSSLTPRRCLFSAFQSLTTVHQHPHPLWSRTNCSQEFYTRDSEEALVLTDHLLWSNWTRAQCPVLVDDGGGRCGDLRSVFVSGLSKVFFFFLKTQSPKNNEDP